MKTEHKWIVEAKNISTSFWWKLVRLDWKSILRIEMISITIVLNYQLIKLEFTSVMIAKETERERILDFPPLSQSQSILAPTALCTMKASLKSQRNGDRLKFSTDDSLLIASFVHISCARVCVCAIRVNGKSISIWQRRKSCERDTCTRNRLHLLRSAAVYFVIVERTNKKWLALIADVHNTHGARALFGG